MKAYEENRMRPSNLKLKICRVCKSDKISALGISREYFLSNLQQTVKLSYSICLDCHTIFQSEFVGEDFLNHYYSQSPMLRQQNDTKYIIDQNKRQSDFVNNHINLFGMTVLEVGAHTGSFLSYIHDKYECDVYFDELSQEAVKIMSAIPHLSNFRTYSDLKFVQLVVLRHILEHINDLDKFFDYLNLITETESYLFIEVPDWSYFDRHVDPFIFEHLSQFNVYGLTLLLRRHGWVIEGLEKSIIAEDPATPNRVTRIIAKRIILPALGDELIIPIFNKFFEEHHNGWKSALINILDKYKDKKIGLYPASHLTFSALSETTLAESEIVGMFDADKKKQGLNFFGIKVYQPKEIIDIEPDLILIFTMAFEPEIRELLSSLGYTNDIISISDLIDLTAELKL